jgi:hypothetical protein
VSAHGLPVVKETAGALIIALTLRIGYSHHDRPMSTKKPKQFRGIPKVGIHQLRQGEETDD